MKRMHRRDFFSLCGAAAMAGVLPSGPRGTAAGAADKPASAPAGGAGRGPNIIFILTDDMGYGDVGCYGGTFARTPNLDKLAGEGTRLTQFYVASPICSPSRVACTSGMFPARWRINNYLNTRKGNRETQQADFLDASAPSLARQLKQAGYATAHFGKWHMGGGRDVTDAPPISAYGFDEWASTWESPNPAEDPAKKDKLPRWQRTAFWADKTIDFLRRHKGQPCYVNLWPDDVHDPHVPSPQTVEKLGGKPAPRQKTAATIEEYDAALGKLFDFLRGEGMEGSTLVVFTGDNGPQPSYEYARTLGLRGQKWSLYEGGIREPFIVKWKGHVPAGRVEERTVSCSVDLLPTLCRIAGAPLPAGAALDGMDASKAWLGGSVQRGSDKALLWEYGRHGGYLRPKGEHDKSPNCAIREGNWKLLVNANGSGLELYDLAADPKETTNLAAANTEVAERLKKRLLEWRQGLPKG